MIEGQLITPTLRLVRLLGRGGMGSVWIADHLTLHTQVAVKFMFVHFATNQAFVKRFQAEAQAAAQIKSPHVAQVFDNGITEEGEPFIVMELLEGEDLRARIKRGGPLSPAELAPILSQVAKALTRAHQVGIVHRDIKPDNVFLANMGDDILVKILDFGIAKLSQDESMGATSTGSMLGTPFYMSPEQLLSSRSVDFRSDLWSLGVVAYQALTGARPFTGETVGALSVAVHAGQYASVSSTRSGLSASIDAWMLKALQRDPAKRFSSAREMADEFEKAMRDPLRFADQVEFSGGRPSGLPAEGSESAGLASSTLSRLSSPSTNPQIGQTGSTGPTLEGSTATTGTQARARRRAPVVIGVGALVATLVAGGLYLRAVRPASGRTPTTGAPAAPLPSATPTQTAASTSGPSGTPSSTPSSSAAPPTTVIDFDEADGSTAGSHKARTSTVQHLPPTKPVTAPTVTKSNKDTIGF